MARVNVCWEHELEMKPSGVEMGSATLPAMKGLEGDFPPACCGKSCTSVPQLPLLLLLETGLWQAFLGEAGGQSRPRFAQDPPGSTRTCRQLSEVALGMGCLGLWGCFAITALSVRLLQHLPRAMRLFPL